MLGTETGLDSQAWSLGLRAVVEAPHEKIIVRDILGSVKKLASMASQINNPVYLALVPGTHLTHSHSLPMFNIDGMFE